MTLFIILTSLINVSPVSANVVVDYSEFDAVFVPAGHTGCIVAISSDDIVF